MKAYFGRQRRMQLSALIVGGLLYGSTASAAAVVADTAADLNHAIRVEESRLTLDVWTPPVPAAGHISLMSYLGSYALLPPPPSSEQTATAFTTRLFGTTSDQEYADAHVRQTDGTYRFTKDSTITYNNTADEDAGVIHPLEDVKIDASDHVLSVVTNTRDRGNAAAIKNSGKNLDIKAGTLRLLTNADDKKYLDYVWGLRNESGTTAVSGMTEADAVGYRSARAVEATAGTVTLEGLKAKVNDRGDDSMSLLAGTSGQIFVNVKDAAAGSHTVNLIGNIGAMGEASRIDAAMVNQDSGLSGLAFG